MNGKNPGPSGGSARAGSVLTAGLIAPILVVVAYFAWRSEVPEPLPTHWGTGGAVNGTTGTAAFFAWCLAVSLFLVVMSAVLAVGQRREGSARLLIAILTSSAWLVSDIYLMTMALSRHAATAGLVALPWYALTITILVPAAVGVAAWTVLPKPTFTAAVRDVSSEVRVGPREKLVWISHAHSMIFRVAAALLVVVAGVLVFFFVWPATILFVIAVLIAFVSEITVRVDDAGLHTIWGPLGWPRQVIPLDSIIEAHAQDIRPMQWGGWGFRITSKGTAANIRSGPGIVLERRTGNIYVVTVDDADQGAGVLNALRDRSATA
jgi:hypothetical protein